MMAKFISYRCGLNIYSKSYIRNNLNNNVLLINKRNFIHGNHNTIPHNSKRFFGQSFLSNRNIYLCCIQKNLFHHITNSQGAKCFLTPSTNLIVGRRNLSVEWLDRLAVTQAGWFQALSKSSLVQEIMAGFQAFHDISQLSWSSSIIISTIILRTLITFPLSVYQVSTI